jgi:hypothetical protein
MRLTSGQIAHGRCSAAVLLAEEKKCGWFLSCQARALSDLTIELSAANKYHVLRISSYAMLPRPNRASRSPGKESTP